MRHFINRLKWSITFPRMIDIATVLFCIFVLSALFLHCCQRQQLKAEITEIIPPPITNAEFFLINKALHKKCGDCDIERTWYGFR